MATLSTQNYKGTRDFYPEDMRLQRYIFDVWRKVSERYGYEEYDAPLIEMTDLYRAKTGEEIVNEQTYSFTDRGGRDVTLRPEMTPSLARMVAAKERELRYPLRWYAIPNIWRYERPQHGRLREHWQLNADIFGVEDITAELEIIRLAHALMHEFGADDDMFVIKINSRDLMAHIFGDYLELSVDASHRLEKLLDRKSKISEDVFINQADAILNDNLPTFLELLKSTRLQDLPTDVRDSKPAKRLLSLAQKLHEHGVSNIKFDLALQRGFDYYTGIVFEIFDTNPDNPRSLFGGGRYDDLLSIFKAQKIPAVGFGMGDVGISNFLKVHDLLPKLSSTTTVYIATVSPECIMAAEHLATQFRSYGINTAVDPLDVKMASKIKSATQKNIPYLVVIGPEEIKKTNYTMRSLDGDLEWHGSFETLIARLK